MGLFDKLFGKPQPAGPLPLNVLFAKADAEVDAVFRREWNWLVTQDLRPIRYSAMGDVFLLGSGGVSWLRCAAGELDLIAENEAEFTAELARQRQTWLQADRVTELMQTRGIYLEAGNCYGYKVLPVLGGKDDLNNFTVFPLQEYIGFTGSVRRQVHDLPPGATLQIKIVD